jgi:hypothetical protein
MRNVLLTLFSIASFNIVMSQNLIERNWDNIPDKFVFLIKSDTIYDYWVYQESDKIDSIRIFRIFIMNTKNKNICEISDTSSHCEYKFKKKLPSKWFKTHNPIYFHADAEYRMVYKKEYWTEYGKKYFHLPDKYDGEIYRNYLLFVTRRYIKLKK